MSIRIEYTNLSCDAVKSFLVETDAEFPTPLSVHTDLDAYADKLSSLSDFVIGMDGEELVGMISCYTNRPPDGYISNICIKKDYRGHGLFSSLLATLLDHLLQRDFHTLTLQVERMNTQAIAIYRHCGFTLRDTNSNSPKVTMMLSL